MCASTLWPDPPSKKAPVPEAVGDAGHLYSAGPAEVTFGPLAMSGGAFPVWDRDAAAPTCSNVYCHGATLEDGENTDPVWTVVDGTEAECPDVDILVAGIGLGRCVADITFDAPVPCDVVAESETNRGLVVQVHAAINDVITGHGGQGDGTLPVFGQCTACEKKREDCNK